MAVSTSEALTPLTTRTAWLRTIPHLMGIPCLLQQVPNPNPNTNPNANLITNPVSFTTGACDDTSSKLRKLSIYEAPSVLTLTLTLTLTLALNLMDL